MSDANAWQQVLTSLKAALEPEDYRRWFSGTAYASDSGDQITVWVPTEGIRRHLTAHYHDMLDRALDAVGRPATTIRFVVAGFSEEEEE
jgi:chromosomal replication initiation ATPase DnaA